jgi:glycogen debranching enzyme
MTATERPVLLTSLASAALLDGRGDLEFVRETRGARVDWGGVYGQLVHLTGPWRLSLSAGDSVVGLPETQVTSAGSPGVWRSHHRWGRFEVDQTIAAVADPPGVVRAVRVSLSEGLPAPLTVESRWSPYLLPVLVEGIRPVVFRAETRGEELRVRQRGFGLAFRSSVLPTRLYLNRASWIGGRFEGRIEEVGSDHELRVTSGASSELTFLVHGGLERELGRASAVEATLRDPRSAAALVEAADAAWEARTPMLRFPDAPRLERAYSLARAALRRLYSAPGEGLTGLVAGYPWYSAIWCRDLAWMLPAVLWLGDFDWTEQSLASVFRFQSRADVPILGGAPGELPMQFAPGPIFLYGTSDTTLYYPGLVDRFVRHSARTAVLEPWSSVVERILGWGEARTDPETGLLHHGGEAGSIGAVKASVARVRYGIDAPDTTIWDSTDRRAHAIDVQVLWGEALDAGVRRVATGPHDPRATRWAAEAGRVADSVRRLYPWSEEGYLFDSLGPEGPVRKLRPNALRAVSAGWLDPNLARSVVQRAARDDLTTPWGVRSLSDRHPTYDPQAYHDGQVWTIATAWAADAALAAGERELGVGYLDSIATCIEEEGGFANECYRGDRPEPFDSCFLLGFSVAPFLTVLFERLWGLRADMTQGRLEVHPTFPANWTSASLSRLTLGGGTVDLDWTPRRLAVRWSGPASLTVVTPAGGTTVPEGESRSMDSS